MNKLLIIALLLSSNVFASEWTGPDKTKHVKAGLLIASISQLATEDWKTSLALCTGAAIGKELYDELSYGGFDYKDAAVTLVGGCLPGVLLGDTILKGLSWDGSRGIQYSMEFKF